MGMTQIEIVLNGIDEVRNSGIQCPLENVEPHRCFHFPEKLIDDIVSLLKAQDEVITDLLKVGYPHNFQREEPWIVNYMYDITGVVRKAVHLRNG